MYLMHTGGGERHNRRVKSLKKWWHELERLCHGSRAAPQLQRLRRDALQLLDAWSSACHPLHSLPPFVHSLARDPLKENAEMRCTRVLDCARQTSVVRDETVYRRVKAGLTTVGCTSRHPPPPASLSMMPARRVCSVFCACVRGRRC